MYEMLFCFFFAVVIGYVAKIPRDQKKNNRETITTFRIGPTAILSVTLIDGTVALVLTQIPKIPGEAGCITGHTMSTKWTL